MSDKINLAILEHIESDEFPYGELPRIARALRATMVEHARCPKGLDASTPDVCPVCLTLRDFEFGTDEDEQPPSAPGGDFAMWVKYSRALERQLMSLLCSCTLVPAGREHAWGCDAEEAIVTARMAASGEHCP